MTSTDVCCPMSVAVELEFTDVCVSDKSLHSLHIHRVWWHIFHTCQHRDFRHYVQPSRNTVLCTSVYIAEVSRSLQLPSVTDYRGHLPVNPLCQPWDINLTRIWSKLSGTVWWWNPVIPSNWSVTAILWSATLPLRSAFEPLLFNQIFFILHLTSFWQLDTINWLQESHSSCENISFESYGFLLFW